MHCKNCGQSLEPDSRFCRHCGSARSAPTAVKSVDARVRNQPAASRRSKFVPVLVGGGAVAAVIGLFWSGFAPQTPVQVVKQPTVPELKAEPDRDMEADAAALRAKVEAGIANGSIPTVERKSSTGKWVYSGDYDRMRGTTDRYANLSSENSVNLGFPYGEVYGRLQVRKRSTDGLNIMFSIDKGQILCRSYTESYLSIKFDNGPIQRFSCTGAADGTSEVSFIISARKFLNSLIKSNQIIVEVPLYQNGSRQFTFETKGLDWK